MWTIAVKGEPVRRARRALVMAAAWSLLLAGCGGSEDSTVGTGQATISSSGGSVTSVDGKAAVSIPLGAVAAESAVSLSTSSTPVADSALVGHTVFRFESSEPLVKPVLLKIRYSTADLPVVPASGDPVINVFDGTTWVPVQSTADAASQSVTASVSSPGTFAILYGAYRSEYRGNYFGSFQGARAGNWHGTFDATGRFSGTISASGGSGTGMVDIATGQVSIQFQLADTTTLTFVGNLNLFSDGDNYGGGTWSSSPGSSGTWDAHSCSFDFPAGTMTPRTVPACSFVVPP